MSSRGNDGRGCSWDDEASFYRDALVREAMEAANAEGPGEFGDVVSDLRRRVRDLLHTRPGDLRLMLRTADALSRAAATEHRLNPTDQEQLLRNVERLMEGLGNDLLPPPEQ